MNRMNISYFLCIISFIPMLENIIQGGYKNCKTFLHKFIQTQNLDTNKILVIIYCQNPCLLENAK